MIRVVLSMIASALLTGGAAAAQQQEPPATGRGQVAQTPRNLQVLDKETSQEQLQQVMQSFSAALGVQCVHCHVQAAAPTGGRGGRGGGAAAAFDFPADDKP